MTHGTKPRLRVFTRPRGCAGGCSTRGSGVEGPGGVPDSGGCCGIEPRGSEGIAGVYGFPNPLPNCANAEWLIPADLRARRARSNAAGQGARKGDLRRCPVTRQLRGPRRYSEPSGSATNVPLPGTVTTRPRSRSSRTALRAVRRAMPYSSASRVSAGIGRSGCSSPDLILAATMSANCTYSGVALSCFNSSASLTPPT